MFDLIRQFIVLCQRSLSVLFSDPVTLILILLLLPLTGILQLIIGSKDVLTGDLSILADPGAAAKTLVENYAPYAKTNTFVFVMGLEAVLTELFVSSNDLVKERSIYLRERMVNLKVLKVLPYLMSKALIYSIFVVIQVLLYAFEPLSYFSTTRWSLTALGISIDMPKLVESTILCSDIPSNPLNANSATKTVCENYKDASKDLLINYDKELLLKSWLVLIGMSTLFLATTGILLARTKSD